MMRLMNVMLTNDRALVLFELLARSDEHGQVPILDAAEQQVLWAIEGQLERHLVEPLDPNYRALLAEAKARISARAGDTAAEPVRGRSDCEVRCASSRSARAQGSEGLRGARIELRALPYGSNGRRSFRSTEYRPGPCA
jgi:hypothetical protein